jgi:pimeloyl-ACP methyl ester carboxylesterase
MLLNYVKIESTSSPETTPIVMLHGWGRNLADLKPLADIISNYRSVYLIDLPGFGKSDPPPLNGWSTKEYAEHLLKFFKEQNLTKVIMLGHSFGGRVSLRIVALQPDLVEKLILIDSHGLRPIRTFYQNIRVALIKKLAKLVKFIDRTFKTKLYQEKFAKKFGSADYQNAGVLKNTFVKTISENQEDDVTKIATPTLLLWGSLDTETPLVMGRRFNELISGSKLVVLEGKDHNPYQGVGAHLCANYIIDFI